jgi:sugar phosphate isomerase/epimerase
MSSRGQGSGFSRPEKGPGRREFLSALGAAALSGKAGWLEGSRVGRAATLGNIGIQLYTVRRELAKDVEGTLAKVAGIGFREVEFAGYPDGTAQSLRKILDRNGLRAPSSHVSTQNLRADWDRTLEQAAIVGQRYVVVASTSLSERSTADGWKRLAALFNKTGEASHARGIQFAYHNHDLEFVPVDGVLPYDLLLQETDPRLVQLEMDLYWITKGGKDPLAYFAKWPGRFPLVHVKDMDATPRRFFTDVGKGTIDFKRIFAKAKQAGIRHYFYEQDETPGSPFDSARVSYEYLRSLTF